MRSFVGLCLAAVAASSPVIVDHVYNDAATAAPIVSASNAKAIPNSYMIVFKKHVTEKTALNHHSWVQDLHLTYKKELKKRGQASLQETIYEGLKHTYNIPGMLGYSGHFDEETIEQVRRHPDVDYIEMDSEVYTMKEEDPEVEKGSPWGLARVSHRKGLTFATFNKVRLTLSLSAQYDHS